MAIFDCEWHSLTENVSDKVCFGCVGWYRLLIYATSHVMTSGIDATWWRQIVCYV